MAYSGGKDSDCIKILAYLAGVKFEAVHNLTTADAPETYRYIRSQKDVRIDKPEINMFKLIEVKMTPPTRTVRYCCQVLKERGGQGKVTVTGVRWAESAKRANSSGLVTIIGKPKTTQKAAESLPFDGFFDGMRAFYAASQHRQPRGDPGRGGAPGLLSLF